MGRIKLRIAQGETEAALEDIRSLEEKYPADPTLAYYASLARAEIPRNTPAHLHQAMFDDLAERFDKHLVLGLNYQLPKIVAGQLIARHPNKDFNLLDLGCGTGLLGLFLGPMQGYLIGVDSSLKMIEEAAKHGVYDRFHNVDLLDALKNTPANEYDVLTLLDVLIYIGDPELVLPNAARILKPGGELIFSCETAPEEGPDFVLQGSHRYAHKRSHIESLCKQAGFSVSTEELVLRQEGGQPLQGFVVTAIKTAA
jgi:predicted TPR repeat methyltransferase